MVLQYAQRFCVPHLWLTLVFSNFSSSMILSRRFSTTVQRSASDALKSASFVLGTSIAEVSAPISDAFRSTMSRISAQAMILTSAYIKEKSTRISALHGMTLSSVCSLSILPQPLLQFNLHLPSYTSSEIHKNQYVAIHLLPPTETSAQLGRIFSSGVKREVVKTTDESGEGEGDFHEMTTPFAMLDSSDWYAHDLGAGIEIPILKQHERVMICEAVKDVPVGSHEIWVVKVLSILQNHKYKEKTGGLLYFDRQFHAIGKSVELQDKRGNKKE